MKTNCLLSTVMAMIEFLALSPRSLVAELPLQSKERPQQDSVADKQADSGDDSPRGVDLAADIKKMKGRSAATYKYSKRTLRILFSDKLYRCVVLTRNKVVGDKVLVDDMTLDNREGRRLTLDGLQASKVTHIALSPDGRFIGCSTNQEATFWNADKGRKSATLYRSEQTNHIQFSPTGKFLFTSIEKTQGILWEGRTGKRLAALKGHSDVITMVRFNKDETLVLTGSKDQTAGLWDVATGKRLQTMKHRGAITAVCFSPDETSILTASNSGRMKENSVKVWAASTGKLKFELKHGSGVKASFRSDGKRIVSVSHDAIIWWNASDGKKLIERNLKGITHEAARFAPDRQHLIVFYGRDAVLWNLFSPRPINKFKKAGDSIYDQFSSDLRKGYRTFYTFSGNGAFKFWPIEASKTRR